MTKENPSDFISDSLGEIDNASEVIETLIVQLMAGESSVSASEVSRALQFIIDKQNAEHEGQRGRKPTQIQTLKNALSGRETEGITLEELADLFPGENPRKRAASVISMLGKAISENNLDLEIKSETIYYFRRRQKP